MDSRPAVDAPVPTAAELLVALGAVAAVEVLFVVLGATGPLVAAATWTGSAAATPAFPERYLVAALAAGYWFVAGAAVALLARAVDL